MPQTKPSLLSLLILLVLFVQNLSAQTKQCQQFYLYEDTAKHFTPETAFELFSDKKFTPLSAHEVNIGFTRSVYWLAYKQASDVPPDSLLLYIGHHHINKIHFYFVANDTISLQWTTGDYFPFKQRPVDARQFYFPLTQQGLYLARIDKSNESLQLSFNVTSRLAMLASENNHRSLMALLTGMLLLLNLFGIYLFIISGEKVYILYVLYMATGWMWVLANAGYGFQYFWPELPWFASKARPVFALTPLMLSLMFLEKYIGGIRNKRASAAMKIFNVVLFACIISIFFFNENGYQSAWWYYIQYFIPFISLLVVFIVLAVLLSAARQGNRLAMFYLIAIAVLLVFGMLQISFSLGSLKGSDNFFSNYGLAVGYVVEAIVLTAGLVYRFNRYRIDKEKLLIEMNQQQRDNTRIMMEVQEAERSQVANQLHDVAGSLLSAAKLNLSNLRKPEGRSNVESDYHLQKTEEALDMVSEMVRNLSHALSPVMLQQVGFQFSLEKIIGIVNASGKIQIEHIVSGFEIYDGRLDKYYTALYGIIYELLNNIVKHSGARHALVQVTAHDDVFSILSEDDGVGMDLDNVGQTGIGLAGIRSKVDYFKGRIAFDKNYPRGLIVTIEIPFNYEIN